MSVLQTDHHSPIRKSTCRYQQIISTSRLCVWARPVLKGTFWCLSCPEISQLLSSILVSVCPRPLTAGLTTQRAHWYRSVSCSQPVSTPTPSQQVQVSIIFLGFTYMLAVRPSLTLSQSMRTKAHRNHWSLWLQRWADWRAFWEDGQARELKALRQNWRKHTDSKAKRQLGD